MNNWALELTLLGDAQRAYSVCERENTTKSVSYR